MTLSAKRDARKCAARIHIAHLLSDKVKPTSYSTLAVVVEEWLACPTAFSAVVSSLRTRLSCNLTSSHTALGFLLCTIQLDWRATTGQRQLAGSSIKILLNMSVLIQARDPVGFWWYAMFSNTYSNKAIISTCVIEMWSVATSVEHVVAECTMCSLCTGCYCEDCCWHVHQYHASCCRHTTLLGMQYNDNAIQWHNMTCQHMWNMITWHKTKNIRKCNAKLARLPHLVTNSPAQPQDLPLQPAYAPLGSCQSCTGKFTLGHGHTCVLRGTNTQTHTSTTVQHRSFKTPHQSCIALVWDHSWAQGKGRAKGQRLRGKGRGWRAEAQRERQAIWGTLHTMRHRLPLAHTAAMVWPQPPKLPLLRNAWQDLWLCSLVVAQTWLTLQQSTVRLASTSTLLKYACASSGRPLLTVVWWADKAVYTPNRLLSNMCKVQDNSKNAAWQDVNVLIKQCWCQGASMLSYKCCGSGWGCGKGVLSKNMQWPHKQVRFQNMSI